MSIFSKAIKNLCHRVPLLTLGPLLCGTFANGQQPLPMPESELQKLQQYQWRHGAADCQMDNAGPIEIFRYDANTYILRQNKCLHYEAPFIYLLLGTQKALLLDTGATASANRFPLFATISRILKEASPTTINRQLLVLHSHGHSDHIAADQQFQDKARTQVVAGNLKAIQQHFGYGVDGLHWPEDSAQLDLGERTITAYPLPGHSDDAIALFDERTGWLLTGDSLYPGRLYVRDWQAYKHSIARLLKQTRSLPVTAILGTHIEMSKTAGVDYPMGSTYQPEEAPLPMDYQVLDTLHQLLQTAPDPMRLVSEKFIVQPLD